MVCGESEWVAFGAARPVGNHLSDVIEWETVDGSKYRGVVLEVEGNVAVVLCSDGELRAVELDD